MTEIESRPPGVEDYLRHLFAGGLSIPKECTDKDKTTISAPSTKRKNDLQKDYSHEVGLYPDFGLWQSESYLRLKPRLPGIILGTIVAKKACMSC